jgi:hypothetical protein
LSKTDSNIVRQKNALNYKKIRLAMANIFDEFVNGAFFQNRVFIAFSFESGAGVEKEQAELQ